MTTPYTINDIKTALTNALSPTHLTITDESHKHLGHGGYIEGQVTHIHIEIASDQLTPLSRVNQHRTITEPLKPFTDKGLHAVRISITQ